LERGQEGLHRRAAPKLAREQRRRLAGLRFEALGRLDLDIGPEPEFDAESARALEARHRFPRVLSREPAAGIEFEQIAIRSLGDRAAAAGGALKPLVVHQ